MKIAYIVNTRIPNEKAHGFQIMKMCEQFAKAGEDVTLYVPTRKNSITAEAFAYYDLKPSFNIEKVKAFDAFSLERFIGPVSYYLQAASFFLSLLLTPKERRLSSDTIVYSRNPEIIFLFSRLGYKTVYNAHRFPEHRVGIFLWLIKRSWKIVCNSEGTLSEFEKRGFKNGIAVQNGVDISLFEEIKESKVVLRQKLALPQGKKMVMYVGHLYAWKGIDVVVEAASILAYEKNEDIIFVIVGGTKGDIEKYKNMVVMKRLKNILIVGHKEKRSIPRYMKAADILLLPNIPSTKESEKYTSPIKMFEYMATGVPIIASDLPSLREVLNTTNAFLVPAGDAKAIVGMIDKVTLVRAAQAKKDVLEYSWDNAGRKVLQFLREGSGT